MKPVFIGLLGLCALTLSAHAGPLGEVRELKLGNGLRMLLAPDSSAGAVDVAVWYDAGTVRERAGLTGISHLFEHLMFSGSAHHAAQEHNRLVQAEGGVANATTAADYTCYFQTLPREGVALAFELEADRMASLALSEEALARERRVVEEEKRWRTRANPAAEALQRLQTLAYGAHPYRWPVVGLDEDLSRITLAECQAYFKTHYGPASALVTVVGNFDPAEVTALARRTFGAVPRRPTPRTTTAGVPAQTAPRRVWARADVASPILLAGWPTPPAADPDQPALELLVHVLGAGPRSRLNRALVVDGPHALFAQAGLDSRRAGGLLYVVATVKPDADSAQVERELFAAIEGLGRSPLSEEEFDQARRQFETSMLFGLQTTRARARALGVASMVEGDWRTAERRLDALRALTAADLQRVAARVLRPEGRNVVWSVPRAGTAATPAAQGGR